MYNLLKGTLAVSLLVNCIYAQEVTEENRQRVHSVRQIVDSVGKIQEKEVSEVGKIREMFENGTVSGQVRVMYSGYEMKTSGTDDTYATAIGGELKYELADYHGFNAGVAFVTSHDINLLTGDGDKQSSDMSSTQGSYTELSEAYVNYKYKDLNLRAGRQVIDTPLADSDDVRMVSNTFEAYIASYSYEGFSFMGGQLLKWQGTDAGLEEGDAWQKTGDDGTLFAGATFSNSLLDVSFWYYDFSEENNTTLNIANHSFYTDISLHNNLGQELFLHTNLQYLNQSETDNSGIEASIYGALVEFIAYDFGVSIAYNRAQKKDGKGSFSGYGGGTLYTNMDNMVLDNISEDREVEAVVAGVSYAVEQYGFFYAYGDFEGKADSIGRKEHIVEQNMGIEYSVNDSLVLAAIYVISKDKEHGKNDDYDWNNARVMMTYNF